MATSVRANSTDMENISEIQQFMEKYQKLDKDRKKYMICFFALFALTIIFLIIILVGLTAADNNSTPSNIDTCHSECTSSDNDFVTLTESDSDTPVATYNGYLDVIIQDRNLTNYTRFMTSSGKIIYDLESYLLSLKENLSIPDGYGDIYVSVEQQTFAGNIDYDYLVKSCSILYTGHSLFTIRGSSSSSSSTRKYISDLQIKSEQCDDEILNGLPTTDYFEINGDSYFVECLNGNNDKCQIYRQYTHTFNLINLTRNNQTQQRRRRLQTRIACPIRITFQYNSKTWQCSPTGSSLSLDVIESFTTTIDMIYDHNFNDYDDVQAGIEIRQKINDNPQYITVVNPNTRRRLQQVSHPKPGDNDWSSCANKYMLCQEKTSGGGGGGDGGDGDGCFPAGSIVNTTNGLKFIQDLNIGDKVLSFNSYTGKLEYSDIYMYGRKIKNIETDFVTLYTDNNELKISATGDHFVYVYDDNVDYGGILLKRFKNVIVGKDYIFDDKMNKYLVIKKENKKMTGIYSPYTMNGNIIVNGIISSCYSHSRVVDTLIGGKQAESYLPFIYHMFSAPLRWIYSSNPYAWKLFNSLYPYGLHGVFDVDMFEIIKQAYWALFIQQS